VDVTTPDAFAAALVTQGIPDLLERVPQESAFDKIAQVISLLQRNWLTIVGEAIGGVRVTEKDGRLGGSLTLNSIIQRLRDLSGQPIAPSSIGAVVSTYTQLLSTLEQARAAGALTGDLQYPVLIIDEANVLMEWSNSYPSELGVLLRFFVATTKQTHYGHVVLATSEYAFQTWLTESECRR
jgi:hypothetical protein